MSEPQKPFAWYWYDKLGCLYITGDDRKPDVPADAKPLYEHPAPPPPQTHVAVTYTQAECDEMCEIAERDGYEKAVQEIDQLTGGDGEYRVSMLVGGGVDDERHTPDAPAMIQRIVDRFETLNLLHDAEKSGRDQEWGMTPSQHVAAPQLCGIADPSTRDCPNMKEVGGGMDGERYRCDVCGKGYFLDYDEMK